MDGRPSRVHLPKLVGTVGSLVVVGGAYRGLSFGVTVALAVAAAVAVVALALVALGGTREPEESAEAGDHGDHRPRAGQ